MSNEKLNQLSEENKRLKEQIKHLEFLYDTAWKLAKSATQVSHELIEDKVRSRMRIV